MWYGDDGWYHDDFEGSYAHDEMGYDENDIYDAFDGDPDAYWNVEHINVLNACVSRN